MARVVFLFFLTDKKILFCALLYALTKNYPHPLIRRGGKILSNKKNIKPNGLIISLNADNGLTLLSFCKNLGASGLNSLAPFFFI